MDGEESWYEPVLKSPNEERPLWIEAKLEEGWQLTGNSGFFTIDWRSRNAEFGIFIGDIAYWDHGYGTEVVRLILQQGFSSLNPHRIFLPVIADNQRAIRVYEKVGFIHESRQRQAEYHDGEFPGVIFMSMLRPEWDEQLEE